MCYGTCSFSLGIDEAGDVTELSTNNTLPDDSRLSPNRLPVTKPDEQFENGRWECGRRTLKQHDCCVFHREPSKTDLSSEEISQLLVDSITGSLEASDVRKRYDVDEKPDDQEGILLEIVPNKQDTRATVSRRRKEFLGANVPALDISYRTIDAEDNYPIDLRYAIIGGVDASNCRLRQNILLSSTDMGVFQAEGIKIEGQISLESAQIESDLMMTDGAIEGACNLHRIDVRGALVASDLTVTRKLDLGSATVQSGVNLGNADIGDELSLLSTSIGRDLYLNCIHIGGRALLKRLEVAGNLLLQTAAGMFDAPEYPPTLDSNLILQSAKIAGNVQIKGAKISGSVVISREAEIRGSVEIIDSDLGGVSIWPHEPVHGTRLDNIVQSGITLRDLTAESGIGVGGAIKTTSLAVDECKCDELVIDPVEISHEATLNNNVIHGDCEVAIKQPLPVDLRNTEAERLQIKYPPRNERDSTSVLFARGTRFERIEFRQVEDSDVLESKLPVLDLEDAYIGKEIKLPNAATDPLNRIRFENTKFGEFQFSAHRDLFRTENWNFHKTTPAVTASIVQAAITAGIPVAGVDTKGEITDVHTQPATLLQRMIQEDRDISPLAAYSVDDAIQTAADGFVATNYHRYCPWHRDPISNWRLSGYQVPEYSSDEGSSGDESLFGDFRIQTLDDEEVLKMIQRVVEATANHYVVPEMVVRPLTSLQDELERTGIDEHSEAAREIVVQLLEWHVDGAPWNEQFDDYTIISAVDFKSLSDSTTLDQALFNDSALRFRIQYLWGCLDHASRRGGETSSDGSWIGDLLKLKTQTDDNDRELIDKSSEVQEKIERSVKERLFSDSGPYTRITYPPLNRLEQTYLNAKVAASNSGDNLATAEFFYRESKWARLQHWNRFVDQLGGTSTDPQGNEQREEESILSSGYNWVSNSLLWAVTGYGERPQRVIGFSSLIVLLWTGFFYLANRLSGFTVFTQKHPHGDSILGYPILSLESFVTLVLDGPDIDSEVVQLLAQIEGFLGVFLIGVFVFTLTRSVQRN